MKTRNKYLCSALFKSCFSNVYVHILHFGFPQPKLTEQTNNNYNLLINSLSKPSCRLKVSTFYQKSSSKEEITTHFRFKLFNKMCNQTIIEQTISAPPCSFGSFGTMKNIGSHLRPTDTIWDHLKRLQTTPKKQKSKLGLVHVIQFKTNSNCLENFKHRPNYTF